jgi:MFS transporter, DHA2 family, multidrug resistance protein
MRSAASSLTSNRPAITAAIILAVIMQGVDNTIANVALPHIQGSLSASQDQVAWVLTSYIVTAAITMPLSGWLATRFGIKYIFLISIGGFTLASALCGSATSLTQLVFYRALQGVCGAGLVPLAQSVLFQINPPERHGQAMAVFGTGAMVGPIMGPTLGGWLTDEYNWRWVFYINVPVGVIATIGIIAFLRETRPARQEPFDFFGFAALSLGVGALQMMLDRGQLKDWFSSSEIWCEAALSGIGFYLLVVHTATATDRSFLNRELMKNRTFCAGTVLMFLIGAILTGTLALLPTMMQELMDYPVFTTGMAMTPRGFGTIIAMFLIGRIIGRVDLRLIILIGLALTLVSLWQMMGFSLTMGIAPIILSGLLQGFGLGCTFVPLNMIALSNLPRSIMTQGTALRSLMRNLGGSIGISILEAQLAQNTQTVHSRLVEQLRPDNPLTHAPHLMAPFSLTNPFGIAALNAEVTRQAAMVAYIDDFLLMTMLVLACLPLLLLVQVPSRRRAAPAE